MRDVNEFLKKLIGLVENNSLGISSVSFSGDKNANCIHDMQDNTISFFALPEVNIDVTFTGLCNNKDVAELLMGEEGSNEAQ